MPDDGEDNEPDHQTGNMSVAQAAPELVVHQSFGTGRPVNMPRRLSSTIRMKITATTVITTLIMFLIGGSSGSALATYRTAQNTTPIISRYIMSDTSIWIMAYFLPFDPPLPFPFPEF